MNRITEGKARELLPDANSEILKDAVPAAVDLKLEIEAAAAARGAGEGAAAVALSTIESRTELRQAAVNEAAHAPSQPDPHGPLAEPETAEHWAGLDAADFGRIRSASRREIALESIAGHARASPEYANALMTQSPKLSAVVGAINETRLQQERTLETVANKGQAQARDTVAEAKRTVGIDAASLVSLSRVRARQTALLSLQLSEAAAQTVDRQENASNGARPSVALAGPGVPPNMEVEAQATRAIKRPIGDDELSKALLAKFIVSHEKYGLLDTGATEFTFREGGLQGKVAFVDQGKTLNTSLSDKNTIRAMVEVATAKNWKEITVTGTEDFKRTAWFEASLAGLNVRGFEPRDADKVLLKETIQRSLPVNSIIVSDTEPKRDPVRAEPIPRRHIDGDALTVPEREILDHSRRWMENKALGTAVTNATLKDLEGRLRGERVFIGEVIEHGPAPYQFNKDNASSYYVVLKTAKGEQAIWGKGLEEAMKERTVGENIVLLNIGKKEVVVKEQVRDGSGLVVDVRSKGSMLNEWTSDLLSRYSERARTVTAGPDGGKRPAMRVYDIQAPRTAPAREVATREAPGTRNTTRARRELRPDLDR